MKVFNTWKKNKKQNFKYDKLPAKEAYAIPWYRLLVDLIGPYRMIIEDNGELFILKALTIIYPVTGWLEILQ